MAVTGLKREKVIIRTGRVKGMKKKEMKMKRILERYLERAVDRCSRERGRRPTRARAGADAT